MNKYSFLLLLYLVMPVALAQNAESGMPVPGTINLAPMQASARSELEQASPLYKPRPYEGLVPILPPPGQGMYPASIIGGDALPPPAVPTGRSDNAHSSIFFVSSEKIPLIINLCTDTYSHNTHQYMGKRVVLTFKTNMLNAMQSDLIAGILQIDLKQIDLNTILTNGNNNLTIDVSESQLAQIENVLVPSISGQQESQQLFHYLPVVRKFCLWAVILGVVFATVMLSIAAYGMVMSHRGSADRVISTVAGLMVLLMAYTIYCLLVANAGSHQPINQITQLGPQP